VWLVVVGPLILPVLRAVRVLTDARPIDGVGAVTGPAVLTAGAAAALMAGGMLGLPVGSSMNACAGGAHARDAIAERGARPSGRNESRPPARRRHRVVAQLAQAGRDDSGRRPGTSTADAQRIAELEREVRELHRADDILKVAAPTRCSLVIGATPDFRVGPEARPAHECDHHPMATTVLIVDDHPGFRRMARRMLTDAGFDVVGEAADGHGALSSVASLGPEVVLLDIQLPDLNGFLVAQHLADSGTRALVILTSSRSASDYGARVARSSAIGFITKAELSGLTVAALLGA